MCSLKALHSLAAGSSLHCLDTLGQDLDLLSLLLLLHSSHLEGLYAESHGHLDLLQRFHVEDCHGDFEPTKRGFMGTNSGSLKFPSLILCHSSIIPLGGVLCCKLFLYLLLRHLPAICTLLLSQLLCSLISPQLLLEVVQRTRM